MMSKHQIHNNDVYDNEWWKLGAKDMGHHCTHTYGGTPKKWNDEKRNKLFTECVCVLVKYLMINSMFHLNHEPHDGPGAISYFHSSECECHYHSLLLIIMGNCIKICMIISKNEWKKKKNIDHTHRLWSKVHEDIPPDFWSPPMYYAIQAVLRKMEISPHPLTNTKQLKHTNRASKIEFAMLNVNIDLCV